VRFELELISRFQKRLGLILVTDRLSPLAPLLTQNESLEYCRPSGNRVFWVREVEVSPSFSPAVPGNNRLHAKATGGT